jgi:hypothetical protein
MGAKGGGKGATIWVPLEFKQRVKALAQRLGKAEWRVLLDALSLYETSLRKPKVKEELPIVDKVLWYVEKLCMSVGEFKASPTEENLQRTLKTISQVRERLNVDTSLLERALTDYTRMLKEREGEVEARMEVNMALKSVLVEITYKWILREELPTQSSEASLSSSA